MKDVLRFARVDGSAADALTGHADNKNAGSGYGVGWRGRPDELAREIEKARAAAFTGGVAPRAP